jgi:cytochrome P450 family 628
MTADLSAALRGYEPRVTDYAAQLMSHIDRTAGHPIDATDWFNFYSFDVMGDLAWGKSFGMLQNGVKHYFMKSLHADMTNVGLFSHLIWLFPLFKATPVINHEHIRFWKWVKAQVDERRKVNAGMTDLDRSSDASSSSHPYPHYILLIPQLENSRSTRRVLLALGGS